MQKKMSRRKFFSTATKVTATTIVTSSAPSLLLGKASDVQPNIVFIICDQMRGDAMSCLGHSNARTPNLDNIAKHGALFYNHFTNNPVCAPSRVSLFTGSYPHQHGKLTNKTGKFIESSKDTMLGYFRDKGYRLGWIGKNHTCTRDLLRQLDTWIDRAREPFRAYNKFVPPYWHCDILWKEEDCHPRKNTDDAINFINQAKSNKPFFLHISYFDPHPPYMAPAEYTSQYCAADMVLPPFIHPSKLSARLDEQYRALHYDRISDADLRETMRYYYAAIEWGVDYQVGRVVKALANKNLLDNTILVFTSDHGDFMGEYRMVRKGMFLYDALLHVPLVIYAPNRLAGAMKINNVTQHIDIFPTLIDLTNGKIPEHLPGRSLKPFLHGKSENEDDFYIMASAAYSDLEPDYFDHPEKSYDPNSDVPFHTRVQKLTWRDDHRTMMIRTRQWKFIMNESRPNELYDMNDGWIERENLIHNKEHAYLWKKFEKIAHDNWEW